MLTLKSAGTAIVAATAATVVCATFALAAPPPPPPPPPPTGGGNWVCPGGPKGCGGGGGNNPPPAPQPPNPADIAAAIRAGMQVPAPVIYTTPKSPTYVQVKTSFWIDPGVWHDITAVQGPVTVTATPQSLEWNLGDGSKPLPCSGPGSSTDLTNCVHTYLQSSANLPNKKYAVNVTMYWAVNWVCAGPACQGQNGGQLNGMTSQANAQLEVGEIQGNSGQ